MDQLIRKWAVLHTVVQDARDELDKRTGVTAGVIRLCGSRVWQDLQQVEWELWQQHRVRVIGMEGPLVRYSVRGEARTMVVEDWQLAAGIDRYVNRVVSGIEKLTSPGRA